MKTLDLLDHVVVRHRVFSQARELYADRLAPQFNLFEFIPSNETGLSRILAWLLDPKGSHAQGTRFLEAFVSWLGSPFDPAHCADAEVTLEAATSSLDRYRRRMDILIACKGRAIAIENKPYAGDQAEQLADYDRHLAATYGDGYVLLYLSGWGDDPGEGSIAGAEAQARRVAGTLLVRSYADLLPWLDECRKASRSGRVTAFLSEFKDFIERSFTGMIDMDAQQDIIRHISGSPERVGAAFSLASSIDLLKKSLIGSFEGQLAEATAERGWHLVPQSISNKSYWGFQTRYVRDDRYSFWLEFDARNWSRVYFGIASDVAEGPDYAKIKTALDAQFGEGETCESWPWFRPCSPDDSVMPVEYDWRVSPAPWVAIADGSLAKLYLDVAERFRAVLAPLGYVSTGASPTSSAPKA